MVRKLKINKSKKEKTPKNMTEFSMELYEKSKNILIEENLIKNTDKLTAAEIFHHPLIFRILKEQFCGNNPNDANKLISIMCDCVTTSRPAFKV